MGSSGSSSSYGGVASEGAAPAAAGINWAATALADVLCGEGSPADASAAVGVLFPSACALTIRCPVPACPGQLTLPVGQLGCGACALTLVACACSAADLLLRTAAPACALEGPVLAAQAAAEQAALLGALGEALCQQLHQHAKERLEVRSGQPHRGRCLACCPAVGASLPPLHMVCLPTCCRVPGPSCLPLPKRPALRPPPRSQALRARMAADLRLQRAASAPATIRQMRV